eukprot:768096-Hanusia_phi.AAC.1
MGLRDVPSRDDLSRGVEHRDAHEGAVGGEEAAKGGRGGGLRKEGRGGSRRVGEEEAREEECSRRETGRGRLEEAGRTARECKAI